MKKNSFFVRDPLAPYGTRELIAAIIGEATAARIDGVDLRKAQFVDLKQAGLTDAQAEKLMAAIELGRQLSRQPWDVGAPLRSSADVFAHFSYLETEVHEFFYVVLLNNKESQTARREDIGRFAHGVPRPSARGLQSGYPRISSSGNLCPQSPKR